MMPKKNGKKKLETALPEEDSTELPVGFEV
jgi:hypothetical protein